MRDILGTELGRGALSVKEDYEIARDAELRPIGEIAKKAGFLGEELEPYGNYMAKISLKAWERLKNGPDGELILVTTINPTPAGEGKTTITIGLAQALAKLGKKTFIAIREPSLGPVFGIKGGAAGGGYSQVLPMEDINLHFTGDIHAITAAHNLISAVMDNHLHFGNALNIDCRRILWPRVIDMNDRALRNTVVGLGGPKDGVPHENSFSITAASEIMAILCLSTSIEDLKERIGNIMVAYDTKGKPVMVSDLKIVGAVASLLKHAVKPNLVQSIEGVPAFVHGGPFANIAIGTNSLMATKIALKLSDYVVTEAGFGADLGAEKYFDIVSRIGALKPELAVVVVTARALKHHGGVKELGKENTGAVERGFANLKKHLQNISLFGVPVLVAINRFEADHESEISKIKELCEGLEVPVAVVDVHARGGEGGLELAEKVIENTGKSAFKPLYPLDLPLREKIEVIATSIYGARTVAFSSRAEKEMERLESLGFGNLPVCMAKTQYSFSDDPKKRGVPKRFKIKIREMRISAGAGFVVPITGTMTTMPGLPRHPAAEKIDMDENGDISGLF